MENVVQAKYMKKKRKFVDKNVGVRKFMMEKNVSVKKGMI